MQISLKYKFCRILLRSRSQGKETCLNSCAKSKGNQSKWGSDMGVGLLWQSRTSLELLCGQTSLLACHLLAVVPSWTPASLGLFSILLLVLVFVAIRQWRYQDGIYGWSRCHQPSHLRQLVAFGHCRVEKLPACLQKDRMRAEDPGSLLGCRKPGICHLVEHGRHGIIGEKDPFSPMLSTSYLSGFHFPKPPNP